MVLLDLGVPVVFDFLKAISQLQCNVVVVAVTVVSSHSGSIPLGPAIPIGALLGLSLCARVELELRKCGVTLLCNPSGGIGCVLGAPLQVFNDCTGRGGEVRGGGAGRS